MLIDFSGDPVRGETAQPRAGQLGPISNSGVFASILSALIGSEKLLVQEPETTPPASPQGQADPQERDDPSSVNAAQSDAPDHPSAESDSQWTASPETNERSPATNGGLAMPSALPTDKPDAENEAVEGAVPVHRHHTYDAGLTTQHFRRDTAVTPQEVQSESTDQAPAEILEKTALDTAFVSSSQASPDLLVPTVAYASASGPADTMIPKSGTAADFVQPILTRESVQTVPATNPPPNNSASENGPVAAKPLPMPFVHHSADTRTTPRHDTMARSIADGTPIKSSPLVVQSGTEGSAGNGPHHGAVATSVPPAPVVDLVRGVKRPGQEAGSPSDPRRADGQPPTPSVSLPRSVVQTVAEWSGDAPRTIIDPAAAPAQPTQRGIMQTAWAWPTSGDDGALAAPAGGSYGNLSAAALPPDIAEVQPRLAVDLNREIARQIGAQVMHLGQGRFEMSLSPIELGKVEMWLQDTDNRLTLIINTERPETLDLMRRHIGLLEQEMRQLGFGSLTLQLGADGSTGSHSSQKHAGTPQQDEEIGAGPTREPGLKPQAVLADHLDIRL